MFLSGNIIMGMKVREFQLREPTISSFHNIDLYDIKYQQNDLQSTDTKKRNNHSTVTMK